MKPSTITIIVETILVIVLAGILIFRPPVPRTSGRFQLTGETYSVSGSVGTIEFLVDNKTGIIYMYFYANGNGGFTPLLDAEGHPVHR